MTNCYRLQCFCVYVTKQKLVEILKKKNGKCFFYCQAPGPGLDQPGP